MIGTEIEHIEHVLSEILLNEWEAQGHSMTGKVVKDIDYRVKHETDKIILSGFMYPYANIQARGVKSGKIPFSGRTGRGGTSLYIQALQNYAKARMGIADEKKSLSIAFAIAHTQKKEGMPTSGSYKFTSTGKRTDWIEEALRKNEDRIADAVGKIAGDSISISLDALVAKWNVLMNELV
jgi:hypothetical protein